MSRCSVCEHEQRPTIEEALSAGEPLRELASRFGLSKSALGRHRDHIEFPGAVVVEQEALVEPDPPTAEEAEQKQPGQVPIVEAAPKPLSPAEAQWDKFLERLEALEAEDRKQSPKLREAIGRLNDEAWSARQKLAALAGKEAKLVAELARLQAKELDRIEGGEPGNLADELARMTEELASARQALQAEQGRFEELSHQVKDRVRGLQATIRGLAQAPAELVGKAWKSWWWALGKVEEAVTKLSGDIQWKKRWGYPSEVQELEKELPALVAERDILRYCVGRLGNLLKKEPPYLEALILAGVLPPGWSWPPLVKKTEHFGIVSRQTRESWIADPRWS